MISSLAVVLFLTTSVTGAATVETPTQLNGSVYATAMKSGSFHYVDLQRIGFGGPIGPQTETGDAALNKGIQFVSGSLGNSETIVVGTAAYLKANAPALEVGLLWSKSMATKYASRWISFTPGDWPYDSVIEFVVTRTFWDDPGRAPVESLPQKPTSIGGKSTLDGESVESVASSIHDIVKSTNSSFIGDSRVYFDSSPPSTLRRDGQHLGHRSRISAVPTRSCDIHKMGRNGQSDRPDWGGGIFITTQILTTGRYR